MAENINIAGRLHSTATGNVVAGANEIYDDTKGKKQSVVNQETDDSLANRYTKAETYNKSELDNMITTPEIAYKDYDTYADMVAETVHPAGAIYRVANYDGTQAVTNKYAEYSWDGTQYKIMAVRDHGIDDEPTDGSDNLIKSGAVSILERRVFEKKIVSTDYPLTGKYIKADGEHDGDIGSSSAGYWKCTELIPIINGCTFSVTGSAAGNNNIAICALYDASQQCTRVIKVSTDVITPTDSEKYIRFCDYTQYNVGYYYIAALSRQVNNIQAAVPDNPFLLIDKFNETNAIVCKAIKEIYAIDNTVLPTGSKIVAIKRSESDANRINILDANDNTLYELSRSNEDCLFISNDLKLYIVIDWHQISEETTVRGNFIINTENANNIELSPYIAQYLNNQSLNEEVGAIYGDSLYLNANNYPNTEGYISYETGNIVQSASGTNWKFTNLIIIKGATSVEVIGTNPVANTATIVALYKKDGTHTRSFTGNSVTFIPESDEYYMRCASYSSSAEAGSWNGYFSIEGISLNSLSNQIKEINIKSFKEDFLLSSSNYGVNGKYIVKETGELATGSSDDWHCSDYIFINGADHLHIVGNHVNDTITIAALYDKNKVHTRSTSLGDALITPNEDEHYIRVCSYGDGMLEVFYNSLQTQINDLRGQSIQSDGMSALSRSIYPQGNFKGFAGVNTDIPDLPFFDDTYIANADGTIFNIPNVENGELLTAVKDGFSVKKINGVQGRTVTEESYDVVIVGAGTGGTAAAYALKGNNKTVCLVEVLDMLGGNATAARVHSWIQAIPSPHIQAIAQDLGIDISKNWIRGAGETIVSFSDQAQGEVSIDSETLAAKYETDLQNAVTIKKRHRFVSIAEKVDGVVKSIFVENLSNHQIVKLNASFFIDGSADGVICRSACSVDERDYDWGADASSKYDESLAYDTLTPSIKRSMNEPSLFYQIASDVDDSAILNACTTVYRDGDNIVKPSYISPDGYGTGWINPMTGQCSGQYGILTLKWGREELYEEFKKRAVEHWKYIKLSCQQAYEQGQTTFHAYPVSNRLKGFVKVADFVGIRETYRVTCDYMMHQSDLAILLTSSNVQSGRYIAESSHLIDFHNAGSVKGGAAAARAFNETYLRPNGIKYDAIIPHNLKNVLIASRCYGASQIFLAADRGNGTMSMLGYSAGKAILICLEDSLSDVRNVNISKLQSDSYTKFASNVAYLETLYNAHCYE